MGNSESKAEKLNAQGVYGGNEFLRSGKPRQIDLAVRILSQAVEATAPDHPKRPMFLMDRGNWGGYLYLRSGEVEAFTDSVKAFEEAIALARPGHKDRPIILIMYGDLYMKRYQREKTDADLEKAEKLYDEAVSLTSIDHEYWIIGRVSLASCLHLKFEKTKDQKDIDRAIECCENGLATLQAETKELVWGYSVLSGCYLARHEAAQAPGNLIKREETEAPPDLDVAFMAAQGAINRDADHSDGHEALARCLNAKFQQSQSLEDSTKAITAALKGVNGASGIQLQLEDSLRLAAEQYETRFAKTQGAKDLNECIDVHEELVKHLCHADPDRAHSLYLLCDFRLKKYQAGKDGKVLLEAISAGEQGVSAVWAQHNIPERATLLDLLASCYGYKLARKDLTKSTGKQDLERAISVGEEALKMMASDDPRREETAKKVRALKVDGIYEGPGQ